MRLSCIRILSWTLLALLAGGLVSALTGSDTVLSLLTQAVIYAVFALGVGLLLRQNGLVSFGPVSYTHLRAHET